MVVAVLVGMPWFDLPNSTSAPEPSHQSAMEQRIRVKPGKVEQFWLSSQSIRMSFSTIGNRY
jgi:hypothetical protein